MQEVRAVGRQMRIMGALSRVVAEQAITDTATSIDHKNDDLKM